MNKLLLLVLLALFSYALAEPFGKAAPCVKDSKCLSHDWQLVNPAPSDERITLVFALKQRNLDVLEKIVKQVSNPRSPRYGHFLTFEELGALVQNKEAEIAVRTWLELSGVEYAHIHVTPNKEFLSARMSVEVAQKLLENRFYEFVSSFSKAKTVRALEYSLPKEIEQHVTYVANTVQFPQNLRPGSIVTPLSTLATGSTDINLLRSFYNITKTDTNNTKTTQSLFESLGQSFSPSDLTTFQREYNLDVVAVADIIGTNNAGLCSLLINQCAEASLDVQYIMAVAQKAATTFWSIPSSNSDIFLEWIQAVAADSNPPLVHSISYTSMEKEEDPKSMQSFNNIAMSLASRGLTIMVSTGDDGVANFVARTDKSQCGFNPSYPATAQYVTAVGATQGPEDNDPEIMCSSKTGGVVTSGGGFSTVFDQADWQEDQVDDYLKNGPNMPPTSMFNTGGRGYPDVALMGHNYEIVIGGKTYAVSGTSASSPTFAGFISLINDMRFAKKKSALGFLNPTLYTLDSDIFNDITSGTNNCCAADDPATAVCCTYGFTSTTGWDPTTGLGSVNWGLLANALVNL